VATNRVPGNTRSGVVRVDKQGLLAGATASGRLVRALGVVSGDKHQALDFARMMAGPRDKAREDVRSHRPGFSTRVEKPDAEDCALELPGR
jgi:hypothetical protein